MNDTPTSSPQDQNPKQWSGRRPRRGVLFILSVALVGGLIGAGASKALSGPGWRHHFGHGPGFTRTHGPMGFMRGPLTPEKAANRAGRLAKHLAVEVDATPEQSQKLVAIAKSLAGEVLPIRQQIRLTQKSAVDLLTADTLDRTAIEKLRADQMGNFDAVSGRVLKAITDAAEVLTPEQRKKLRERVSEWRDHRGSHSGGHHWNKHRNDD